MLKEEIGIYQQDNKTTIVIYNMRESTKRKIAELLLQDIQAVDDLVPAAQEMEKEDAESVSGMESVRVLKDAASIKQFKPRIAKMLEYIKTGTPEDAATARHIIEEQTGMMANVKLNQIQSYLFSFRDEKEFFDILTRVCRQKGTGDRLQPGTQEYEAAAKEALRLLDEEEAKAVVTAVAQRFAA